MIKLTTTLLLLATICSSCSFSEGTNKHKIYTHTEECVELNVENEADIVGRAYSICKYMFDEPVCFIYSSSTSKLGVHCDRFDYVKELVE